LHSRKQSIITFVEWVKTHIKGDEKGEAQIFLDRLFKAYGHPGVKEAGATLEERIKKLDAKGTAFADLVWKPRVLIEMKKRGEDLGKHYRQAFDYWVCLVPNRPKYVVLCNFDEFWVYDFETQMDTPKERVSLKDLADFNGALAFLSPINEKPVFQVDHLEVTREAADRLAMCFNSIVARMVSRSDAQRFILQMMVALFSEDIGLLEQYTVIRLLDRCKKKEDSYDLLGGMFAAMNNPQGNSGGQYKGIPYFNGGLFAEPARLELEQNEINLLRSAAEFKWSNVRPEIFGTLFEHSLGHKERHAFGQHFTSPVDIMKIVGPTIVEPWREAIESATTKTEMNKLLNRLQHFTVLDPACGSGNFLYIAYRELKRLEALLYQRMEEKFSSEVDKSARRMSFLTASNFYGMDISPFAVELAKVTMVIARKLAIDELHISENALPLDNLDANIRCMDALIDKDGLPAKWPKADVIIGNPPFLGAKRLKPERGPDYVNLLRKAYPDVPGMADYCVYWIRTAHDQLAACTPDDRVAGRAGLVGTQNIRNNQSRVGGLDHVVKNGTIVEAVENQPWSGEANVHVSIANWAKTKDAKLLPKSRKLWFKVEPELGAKKRKRGSGSAGKEYDLAFRECAQINSALSDMADVSGAFPLGCNTDPQRCFNGQMLGHNAFLLSPSDRDQILRRDQKSSSVMHRYLNGVDALTGNERVRYVLDFEQCSQLEAAAIPGAFEWVRLKVLPARESKAKQGVDRSGKMRPHHRAFLSRWWQLSFGRPEMLSVIKPLSRYLACAYVTKRPIFVFISSGIRPSNLIQVFGFDDNYSFGILQSNTHWQWFITKCGKLTERFRYSSESVYDTFPWPQKPTKKQIGAVAEAGREVRRIRAGALKGIKGGLRALYRTLELPGKNPLKDAHAALDSAVLEAYGFSAKKDLLAQILALNMDVAEKIKKGEEVTAPGVPASYPAPAKLVTADCIRAEES